MTKPLIAVCVSFALLGSSMAQNLGNPITASFNAEDVQTHQGKIAIDPSSTTILRFYRDSRAC